MNKLPLLLILALAASALAQPLDQPMDRPAARENAPAAPLNLSALGGKPVPPGPFAPTWDSIRASYIAPEWFREAKFGIFIHWGIFTVPARQSEWYVRYMYGGNAGIMQDHIKKYGPLDKFGYKDFIPRFTMEHWDPDAWAELFKAAGARYVIPSAEHHDGFSMWDSAYNPWNAKAMGPKRDLVGDLAAAVRRAGLKFGVANHSIEHFNFIPAAPNSDQFDPAWKDFYHVADRSEAERLRFNELWVAKNLELIDKYRPDILWFDNGINGRVYDPYKLKVAAYYYNRALEWGKPVAFSTKSDAFLAGSIRDYERQGRVLPREIKGYLWQVDDPIGSKYGYVNEIQYKDAALLVRRLVDTVSMNGNYWLNVSPMSDGTIPQPQQERLLAIGRWLKVNGEAIYGTRAWTRYGEGPYYDAPPANPRGADDPPGESFTSREIRFTTKGDTLYAIVMDWPGEEAVITSLATGSPSLPAGKIAQVELLGNKYRLGFLGDKPLAFTQDAAGLHVRFPAVKPCGYAYALKITGLTLTAAR